ncbi:MAG: hypothetical protein ACQEVA_22280 [Myxococcota bacterium]
MYSFATKSRNRSLIWAVLVGLALASPACASKSEKTDEPATAQPQEPQELSAPPYVGTLQSAPISGMGFQHAVLTIEVNSDFSATGMFEGGYDERYFEVSLEGEVDRMDGSIELDGTVATHDINVAGDLTQRGFEGAITGTVSNEEIDVPMAAEPAQKEVDTSGEDVDAVESN